MLPCQVIFALFLFGIVPFLFFSFGATLLAYFSNVEGRGGSPAVNFSVVSEFARRLNCGLHSYGRIGRRGSRVLGAANGITSSNM